MKGTVFNGFETYVEHQYGLHIWHEVLENSSLLAPNGIFLVSETYDDQDLFTLITSLSVVSSVTASNIQKEFGSFFFPRLYNLIKTHVAHIDNLFDFLRAVDDVIHVEVKKTDASAYTPSFYYDQANDSILTMRYVSKRGMCHFAEGLIEGAAKHFSTNATISQVKCMHSGDKYCLINISI